MDNGTDSILTKLHEELDGDLEGVNEILDTIEKFMDTYKKHASADIIDHTSIISKNFNKHFGE